MGQLHLEQRMPTPREKAVDKTHSATERGFGYGAQKAFQYTSLIDPRLEHDSCGVGFVCSAHAKCSHDILEKALTALARLAHRGAVATDGKSSDGVGLLLGVPKKLLLDSTGFEFDPDAQLGVVRVFLPPGETRAEVVIQSSLHSQDLRVLGWRDVPTCPEVLGEIALD